MVTKIPTGLNRWSGFRVNSFENVTEAAAVIFPFLGSFLLSVDNFNIENITRFEGTFLSYSFP